MIRRAALIAASFLLSACATRSPPPTEAIAAPAPLACDPRLVAPLPDEPPVRGGLVQPSTLEEREAVAAFLTGEAEARAWGREGWARAAEAREACLTTSPAAAPEPVPR